MLPAQMVILVLCASAHVTMQAYTYTLTKTNGAGRHGNEANTMLPADDDLHVYALPVGQGDATLIRCPGGNVTIVDMGSIVRNQPCADITYMTDEEIIYFIGDSPINYVYLTHADQDHYNIIPKLNIPMNVLRAVYIGCEKGDYKGSISNWLNSVDNAGKLTSFGTCTTSCNSSVPICGNGHDISMQVMGANLDLYGNKGCSNGDSLVLRLKYGTNFALVLPGDLEDYGGFKYDSEGYITSCIIDEDGTSLYGQPGVLRTLVDRWAPQGGIGANFYRLAHHGTYPNGNKPFFLQAIAPNYVFSSSMLPGTDGTFNHPNCALYDEMINNPNIPIVTHVLAGELQKDYSCGLDGERYLEDNNTYGIYTTAVKDDNTFYNYIIQISTDGTNYYIRPLHWQGFAH